MIKLRKTSTPLWYIVGIFVIVFLGLFTFFGSIHAEANSDYYLQRWFAIINWLAIVFWFAINVIVLLKLKMVKADRFDFIAPFYFIVLNAFYLYLIYLLNVRSINLLGGWSGYIGMITSAVEILFAVYLFACFVNTADLSSRKAMQSFIADEATHNQSPKKSRSNNKPSLKKSSSKGASAKKSSSKKVASKKKK